MVTNNAIFLLSDFDYLSQKQNNFFLSGLPPSSLNGAHEPNRNKRFYIFKKIV